MSCSMKLRTLAQSLSGINFELSKTSITSERPAEQCNLWLDGLAEGDLVVGNSVGAVVGGSDGPRDGAAVGTLVGGSVGVLEGV